MSDAPPTLNITPPAPSTEPPAAPEPPQAPPEPQYSQYAQDILSEVPEAERAVVEKYLSQWDAGVSRRVSQLEQTYGPLIGYVQESGYDIGEIQTAAELYFALNQDPEGVIDAITKAYQVGDQQQGQPPAQPGQPGGQAPQMQMPPELAQNLGNMNKFMEQMALREEQREAAVQQEAEDKALDDYLSFLEKEKGPYDRDYVLSQMALGVDGAIAVDNFKSAVQKFGQQHGGQPRLPAPPVLHGGAAATGAKPISQASDTERRALVAQIINQANSVAS